MAMTAGGHVVLGVSDERRLVGCALDQGVLDAVMRRAQDSGVDVRVEPLVVGRVGPHAGDRPARERPHRHDVGRPGPAPRGERQPAARGRAARALRPPAPPAPGAGSRGYWRWSDRPPVRLAPASSAVPTSKMRAAAATMIT